MRNVLAVLAICLGALVTAPLAASAAPAWITGSYSTSVPTTNLRSDVFAKSTGGVLVSYWCRGGGDTKVQVVSSNELTAHRSFDAVCDGRVYDLGPMNVVSNTAMRVRIHDYSAIAFTGGFTFACEGRWL